MSGISQKKQPPRTSRIRIAWFFCLVILLIFILNYVYLYFTSRDRTVLYYLITQLGGIIYITGYRWIFVPVLPIRVFNIDVYKTHDHQPNGFQYGTLYVAVCIFLILLILITQTEAYRRKLPYARLFLLANRIQLLFILAIPLFFND